MIPLPPCDNRASRRWKVKLPVHMAQKRAQWPNNFHTTREERRGEEEVDDHPPAAAAAAVWSLVWQQCLRNNLWFDGVRALCLCRR